MKRLKTLEAELKINFFGKEQTVLYRFELNRIRRGFWATTCSSDKIYVPLFLTASKAMVNSASTTIQPTNATTNNKPPGFGHPSTSSLDPGSHAFFIILYLMIFIVGVSGNSLVCYALGKFC